MIYEIKNNEGNVSFGKKSKNVIYQGINNPSEKFAADIERAVALINDLSLPIDKRDKVVEYLNQAVTAKNEKEKLACKFGFKGFVDGAGSILNSVIDQLSKIATIATFFGLNQ